MADLVYPGQAATVLNAGQMPANVDLLIYKGDYVDLSVTIADENGNPIDITGYTLQASIKTDYNAVATNFTASIVSAAYGKVRLYMSSAVSHTLTPGSGVWDFQITLANGDSKTYLTGDVTIYGEVTI